MLWMVKPRFGRRRSIPRRACEPSAAETTNPADSAARRSRCVCSAIRYPATSANANTAPTTQPARIARSPWGSRPETVSVTAKAVTPAPRASATSPRNRSKAFTDDDICRTLRVQYLRRRHRPHPAHRDVDSWCSGIPLDACSRAARAVCPVSVTSTATDLAERESAPVSESLQPAIEERVRRLIRVVINLHPVLGGFSR